MEECGLVENKTKLTIEKKQASILRLEASKNSQKNAQMSEIVKSMMLQRLKAIAVKHGVTADIPSEYLKMTRSCDSCRMEIPFETWELYECFKIFCLCLNRVYGRFINMDVRAIIFHNLKRDNPDSTYYVLKCRMCSSNYDLCFECYSDQYDPPDLSRCPYGFGCHSNLDRLELSHGPLKLIYQTRTPDEDLKNFKKGEEGQSGTEGSPFLQWHQINLPKNKDESYESFGTSFYDIDTNNNSTVNYKPDAKALENMSKTSFNLIHGMKLDVGQGENVPWRLLNDVWLMFRSRSYASIKYGTPSVILDFPGTEGFYFLYERLRPVFNDFISGDYEKNQNNPLFLVFVYPNGDEFWIERTYHYQRGPIKTIFKTYFVENSKYNFSRYENPELVLECAQEMLIDSLPGQFIWIALCSSAPVISHDITLLAICLGNEEDIQEVRQDMKDMFEARRLEYVEARTQEEDDYDN